jgi:hypothetical protein
VLWAVAYLSGLRPVTAYVFGHEFSHLVTARLFGGRIFDWKVSAQGGYVETDKSNTWITLAPYLIPFYTLIIMVVFGIVGLTLDMQQPHALSIWKWTVHLKPTRFLYALVGLTWCFHATYTVKTVLAEQGDLKRNGEFFSMMLIFLINAFLLIALFLAASPSPGLGIAEVARCWWSVASGVVSWLWNLVVSSAAGLCPHLRQMTTQHARRPLTSSPSPSSRARSARCWRAHRQRVGRG